MIVTPEGLGVFPKTWNARSAQQRACTISAVVGTDRVIAVVVTDPAPIWRDSGRRIKPAVIRKSGIVHWPEASCRARTARAS